MMTQDEAIAALAALAQPSRLAVFRRLVRAGPDGMTPGELSRELEIVPSTLSGHLSALRGAGLLRAKRMRREIPYAADLKMVSALVGFLLADCCDGQLENCAEILDLLEAR